ncbi:hypothetical protein [Rhizobium sp. CIAT894]|uniref:hypothetical protein n=1 Tax=Rhizobium sp. CIAT894 TaxID=2020312 RepID=UPI0001909B7A|nr:hypothetical protein [Rhizobium sp. CIAT894]
MDVDFCEMRQVPGLYTGAVNRLLFLDDMLPSAMPSVTFSPILQPRFSTFPCALGLRRQAAE